jgi:hypothetical protein
MAMILAKSSCRANYRQAEKHKAGNFQPENAGHASGVADCNIAGAIERANPAILTRATAGDTHQGPSTGPEVTSCLRIFLALHGVCAVGILAVAEDGPVSAWQL